ncbi:hypothetical protein MMC11_001226 [Xylographa trunciseda]|nr:hypothetical protein [Xylographa trunciseda]
MPVPTRLPMLDAQMPMVLVGKPNSIALERRYNVSRSVQQTIVSQIGSTLTRGNTSVAHQVPLLPPMRLLESVAAAAMAKP